MTTDLVGRIIDLESGELEEAEVIALFVDLLNSGTIFHLQGSYQRTAKALLESGVIVTGLDGKWTARDSEGS